MRNWRGQRGQSRLGAILWILALVAGAMIGYQVIPAKIATAQLKDHVEDLAQRAPHQSQAFYEKSILERAEELDLPVDKKNIKVRKTGTRIVAEVDLVITVDLMVHSFDWPLGFKVDREIFII